MMNAARNTWRCTESSPARLPIDATQRWAVRRSSRCPSRRRRIGPSWRSPMARSIVRAVRGTSGITAGLLPLPIDVQGAVTSFEAEILDVGAARLADPQSVQAPQDCECCGGVGRTGRGTTWRRVGRRPPRQRRIGPPWCSVAGRCWSSRFSVLWEEPSEHLDSTTATASHSGAPAPATREVAQERLDASATGIASLRPARRRGHPRPAPRDNHSVTSVTVTERHVQDAQILLPARRLD
jgi:hypothetical protein